MKKLLSLFVGAMVIASGIYWLTACQPDKNEVTNSDLTSVEDRSNGNSKVFGPSAHPYGKSYEEWAVAWFQVFMGFNCDENPWSNPDYALFYQTGPVYFLAGLNTVGASKDIAVPHGKAILFPLTNYINDYPCPAQYNFEPAPGQSLEDFLSQGIVDFNNNVTELSVEVDGASISNPDAYKFISDLFYFTGDPDLATVCQFDVCVTGESQPAVCGGPFMMLKPLSKGTHTVHYHSLTWGTYAQDGTFNITVE